MEAVAANERPQEAAATDESPPSYQLAAAFEAHRADVKQVLVTSTNSLLSCGRDDTIRLWGNNFYDMDANNLTTTFHPSPPTHINSIAFVEHNGNSYIFGGRRDGSIVVYEINNHENPFIVLQGHNQNVCCLHVNKEHRYLVSGGWDCVALIWPLDAIFAGNDMNYKTLLGHEQSVWALDSFNDVPESILTGSGDRTVKQWNGTQLIRTFEIHPDVVRSIICFDDGTFITGCNDGRIRCFNRENEGSISMTATSCGEFIFSMAMLEHHGNKFVITSMETGAAEIFQYSVQPRPSLKYISSLNVPAQTAWSAAVTQNKDIAVGGSDGIVYLFKMQPPGSG